MKRLLLCFAFATAALGANTPNLQSPYNSTTKAAGDTLIPHLRQPAFTDLSGIPTTLSSYGITDANKTVSSISSLEAIKVGSLTTGYSVLVQGYYAAGDGGGGLYSYNSSSSATANNGTVISPNAGSGRWLRYTSGVFNVKCFGACGNGSNDDTTAITNAFVAASAFSTYSVARGKNSKAQLYFPAGSYVYNGTGLNQPTGLNLSITGDGREHTVIRISSGHWFINSSTVTYSLEVSGLEFQGGHGAIKLGYTGTDVQGEYVIENCAFYGYTLCAIGSDSTDMPYFQIRKNIFYGTKTSKGIALAGGNDMSVIEGNQFLLNLFGIELGGGGQNVKVFKNDFIRFSNGGGSPQLTDVWIAPGSSAKNSGQGCEINENKFGNEGIATTDYRILVADVASGKDFIGQMDATTDDTTNYWVGADILDNYASCGSGFTNGFIYSYVKNVYDLRIRGTWAGGYPANFLEFDSGISFNSEANVQDLGQFDATGFIDGSRSYIPPLSNKPGTVTYDPLGFQQGNPDSITQFQAGFDPGFINFNSTNINTGSSMLNVGSTSSATTDATGGQNASTITYTANGDYCYLNTALINVTVGRRAWLEFDIKGGPLNPVKELEVNMAGTGGIVLRRFVTVPAYWTTIRIPFVMRQTSYNPTIQFVCVNYSSTANEVNIGRVRLYSANQPTNPATNYDESLATWSPGAITNGAIVSTTVTVIGAVLGDFVLASFSKSLSGVQLWASVTSANTVTVYLLNSTGSTITLSSGSVRVRTIHPTL